MKYWISLLFAGLLLLSCKPEDVETSFEVEASGGTIALSDAVSVSSASKYSWITVSQNSSTLTISANNTYDVRSASIEYTTKRGGRGTAHITQKQLDAILLSINSFQANPFGETFEFFLRTNVKVSYNVQGGDWFSVTAPTKGLTDTKYSVTIKDNDTDQDRLGKVIFTQGRLNETLLISQKAKPEVLKNSIPGLYLTSSKRQYIAGEDQIIREFDGDDLTFVVANPVGLDQLEINGYSSDLGVGSSTKISVSWNKESKTYKTGSYIMTVYQEKNGLVWLADDAGNGVLIKK